MKHKLLTSLVVVAFISAAGTEYDFASGQNKGTTVASGIAIVNSLEAEQEHYLRPWAIKERGNASMKWMSADAYFMPDIPAHMEDMDEWERADFHVVVNTTLFEEDFTYDANPDYDGKLFKDVIPKIRDQCKRLAGTIYAFNETIVKQWIFGKVDIRSEIWCYRPPNCRLVNIAPSIAGHMAENWFHLRLVVGEKKGVKVLAAMRLCKIGNNKGLQMVFLDNGPGISNIEYTFEQWFKRTVESQMESPCGWGTALTRGILLDNRTGNIQVASGSKSVTYFYDGTKKVERRPILNGTLINIVIFPPVPQDSGMCGVGSVSESIRFELEGSI